MLADAYLDTVPAKKKSVSPLIKRKKRIQLNPEI